MDWKFWKKDATQKTATPAVTEGVTRSSARVQMALLVEMVRMLQEYEQCQTLPAVPVAPVMPDRLRELEAMGFTNTAEWKDYKVLTDQWQQRMKAYGEAVEFRRQAIEAVDTLRQARRQFGRDTLLVRFDDFERLMDKYNLVCGTFDYYTGDVPLEKMIDISTLLEQSRGWRKPVYMTTLRAVTGYEIINFSDSKDLPSYLSRFPFVKSGFMVSTNDFHGNKTWDFDRGYKLHFGQETSLFLCAPAKDMKPLKRVVSLRSANDPFICAHTDHGILVFTRCGEEADDAIVRKYELADKYIQMLKVYEERDLAGAGQQKETFSVPTN